MSRRAMLRDRKSSRSMNTKDRMKAKLEAALAPIRLEIEDESHLHAGHSGARAGGETTIEAVRTLVPVLRADSYDFVTVSTMLA